MAPEALMEMWSLLQDTPLFVSQRSNRKTIIDPTTRCCASQQLGYGKSRARSQDLEGSGRLRLDIESYGSATRARYPPDEGPASVRRSSAPTLRMTSSREVFASRCTATKPSPAGSGS